MGMGVLAALKSVSLATDENVYAGPPSVEFTS